MAYVPSVGKKNDVQLSQVDAELERILAAKKARIKVVGVGGAGNNTMSRMSEIGITGAELIAINTDAQDLIATVADKKILIGKELTGGLGAGANPKVGEDAARETEAEVKEVLKGFECGILLEGQQDIKEGDILQAYEITYLEQDL